MKTKQGTPSSMVEAIRRGRTDEERERNVYEFIRNRMNVISMRGDVQHEAMMMLLELIERQKERQ